MLWTFDDSGLRIRRWGCVADLAKEYGLNPKRLGNQIESRGPFCTSIICGGVTVYTENPIEEKPPIKMGRPKGAALLPTLCTHGMGVWRDIPNPGAL